MTVLFDRVHLVINRGVLERVLQDCVNHLTVEIGGRWFGWYIPAEERHLHDERLGTEHLSSADLHYVIDYIPTGPNADSKTDVELQPDREYQLWVYERLLEFDSTLAILGSWHSHIPNGLEIFSRGDWMSYHSKLNDYPYPRMLCSLIHTEAHTVEDIDAQLRHSWWPKGEEMGVHHWVEPNEVIWEDDVEVPCAELIVLDYSAYNWLREKHDLERELADARSQLEGGESRLHSEQTWIKRFLVRFFGREVDDKVGELSPLKEWMASLEQELEEIDQKIRIHFDASAASQ